MTTLMKQSDLLREVWPTTTQGQKAQLEQSKHKAKTQHTGTTQTRPSDPLREAWQKEEQ